MYSTTYDTGRCGIGIIHVGYGCFHRAHQAVYIDDYMEHTGDLRWGIVAVNLRNEGDAPAGGYILRTPTSYRCVRSHVGFADWTVDKALSEDLLRLRGVRCVTVTVTEGGYAAGSPIYEYLAAGLVHRRAPLTIVSCDNVAQNGRVLRDGLQAHLKSRRMDALWAWVEENVAFPCTVVDRITPRPTERLRMEVESILPGRGQGAIHAEDFSQWVIEDALAAGFPKLELAGAIVTDCVAPYEEAKLRILNASHTLLAYFGALLGYRTFHEVMGDPQCRAHFWALATEETIPTLGRHPSFDPYGYALQVERRLSNPAMADTLDRICADGYGKMRTFVAPIVRDALRSGHVPVRICRSIVSWNVCERKGGDDSIATDAGVWGDIPARYPAFSAALASMIREHPRGGSPYDLMSFQTRARL